MNEKDPDGPSPMDALTSAIESHNQSVGQPFPSGRLGPQAQTRLPPPSTDIRSAHPHQHVVEGTHPGFEARFREAFRLPWVGVGGVLWQLVMASTWAIGLNALTVQGLQLFGAGICALAVGLHAVHFGQAAMAGSHDEGGPLHVLWSLPERHDLSMLGVALAFGAAGILAPAQMALRTHHAILAVVLLVAFLAYWPLALTGIGITGRLTTALRPVLLGRASIELGVSYLKVWGVLAALVLPPLFIALAGLPHLGLALLGPALAYASGVVGFLMGCLTATEPQAFRPLQRRITS